MARPQSVENDIVIDRLSGLFRAEGYEGASLTRLADCAGLKKASLYHRFPRGKQQMAEEVLAATAQIFETAVLAPLNADGPVGARLHKALAALEAFYGGGRLGCLLNLLAAPGDGASPFAGQIAGMFTAVIAAFAKLARDAGLAPAEAEQQAGKCVALLEGGLVLARGLNAPQRFTAMLALLPRELGVAP